MRYYSGTSLYIFLMNKLLIITGKQGVSGFTIQHELRVPRYVLITE